jgi:hypothetical protein
MMVMGIMSPVSLTTTHRYGSVMTLDNGIPARTGYTFFRWNTDSMSNGEDLKPGNEFTI